MKIIREGKSWKIEGRRRGWAFNKTYPTQWRAELALAVYNRGGKISEYWAEARKGRPPKEMKALLQRIESDPRDAEAYYGLAICKLRMDRNISKEDPKAVFSGKKIVRIEKNSTLIDEAEELINTAMGIGLQNPFSIAKAKYLLICLLISKEANTQDVSDLDPMEVPRIHYLIKDTINDLEESLSLDSYNMDSLFMKKTLYEIAGDLEGVGRTEQKIREIQSLKKIGIIRGK